MDEPDKKPGPEKMDQAQPGPEPGLKPAGSPAEQAPAPKPEAEAAGAPESVRPETSARPRLRVTAPGEDEQVAELEPSPELQSALDEAMKSLEKSAEKKKKEEERPRPSEEELKLKVEIIDLRHKVRQLEQEVEKKAKEVKQNYDQGMMLKNQFEAYKARIIKEKSEWLNYGFEPVFKELIHVIDNFERALSHAPQSEEIQGFKQGVELIARQLLQMLEKFGVKPIQALNQTFDPAFHEAMSQVVSDEHPDNSVVQEHARGYMFKDRLLRPAMVTISRVPAKEQTAEQSGPGAEEKIAGASAPDGNPAPAAEDKTGKGKNPEGTKTEGS